MKYGSREEKWAHDKGATQYYFKGTEKKQPKDDNIKNLRTILKNLDPNLGILFNFHIQQRDRHDRDGRWQVVHYRDGRLRAIKTIEDRGRYKDPTHDDIYDVVQTSKKDHMEIIQELDEQNEQDERREEENGRENFEGTKDEIIVEMEKRRRVDDREYSYPGKKSRGEKK